MKAELVAEGTRSTLVNNSRVKNGSLAMKVDKERQFVL